MKKMNFADSSRSTSTSWTFFKVHFSKKKFSKNLLKKAPFLQRTQLFFLLFFAFQARFPTFIKLALFHDPFQRKCGNFKSYNKIYRQFEIHLLTFSNSERNDCFWRVLTTLGEIFDSLQNLYNLISFLRKNGKVNQLERKPFLIKFACFEQIVIKTDFSKKNKLLRSKHAFWNKIYDF